METSVNHVLVSFFLIYFLNQSTCVCMPWQESNPLDFW